jgi:hypothetical protein
MPHVLRDTNGRIMAVLDRPSAGATEEVGSDDPEILAYLTKKGPTSYFDLLRADLEFIRVIEDLIAALINRNVILLTDLPAQAQEKLLQRGSLRRQFRDKSGMLTEDEDVL